MEHQFEAYFQRADLDRDGRISGAEAVGFFQGSNLSKQVLAQIWTIADQNRIGYLSRPEFYNALKLVTVAQSKRELTPDIVKAALYGPASAKIPAPQINLAATPAPRPVGAAPSPRPGAPGVSSSQSFGFRGQTPSNASVNPQIGLAPSTTLSPSSSGMNQQFRQAQPSGTGINQQFGQVRPSSTGMNLQYGQQQPSNTGINQQFGQVQPSSTGMNQHFGVQPSSTGLNQQFGLRPSSTGSNQQFGPAPSSTNMNPQFFPSHSNQSMRPTTAMPTVAASRPPQNAASPNTSRGVNNVDPGLPNLNNDWFGGKSAASTGPTPQVINRGPSPSTQPVAPNPQDLVPSFSSTAAKDPKGYVGSGNRTSLDPMFGAGMFSVNQSSPLQASSASQNLASSMPISSAIVPVSSAPEPSAKPDPFEVLQSTYVKPSTGGQAAQPASLPKSSHQVPNQVTSSVTSSGFPGGVGNSVSEQSQISWPKMTRASIQKYAKVFMEVDTDRDGKITGEQARNLFLSWRLPIEILKQVWDLSDQDSDSMLSLREFCISLYLMERYREGSPLPSTLPNSVMLDETLLSLAGPPTAYGSMGWGAAAGIRPPQGLPGARPIGPAGLRPPIQPMYSQADGSMQINQQNARGPVIDNSHANQFSNGEENPLETNNQEAPETNEKVENNEKMLLDSREKLEFYRTKMQDLVLYKSRCDNRLNEITERARADKIEAELLEKKYQEKYKQVAEIHSKLTIEEATFREVQERKTELHQAIVKMEQGGSADGILQVRADRIQSELEELLKALTDRCKKHSIQMKSAALIELPPGWPPGVPEIAAIWDEDWDKFEDEGFSFDVAIPANSKPASVQKENSSPTHSLTPDSVSNADSMSEKPFSTGASAFDTESVYSADEPKSPQGSPGRRTSPSQEYPENHFTRSPDRDAETHRSFDEPNWGSFDNNDDIDSVWGFNSKESDYGKHEEKHFFGSNDFAASPERTHSRVDNSFQKNSPFTFEDSVPGTPVSRPGNSPPRYSMDSKDPFFDSSSRYDSFSVQDRGSPPRRENLTRFDSINSTRSFDHGRNFSFDDSDPFGSSGPFKVSSETSKKESESWKSF